MIRRLLSTTSLLFAATLLSACGGVDSDESVPVVTEPSGGEFYAVYKPSFALAPFPNDIYFSGTTDGTLNIPASANNTALTALNSLDGYSTTASIYVETTDTIASASLVYGATVFLVNTDTFGVAPATVGRADYANGTSVIEIVPSVPLDPATTYAGFVTNNVQSTTGDALGTDEVFQALLDLYADGIDPATTNVGELQAIYTAVYPLLQLADGAGIGAADLAVAWSFKTQSVSDSLDVIEATAVAQDTGFLPIPANGVDYSGGIYTTADANPALQGKADVYVGVMEVPYYHDPSNPLSSYWTPASAPCQAVVDAVSALSEQPESTTSACPTPAVNTVLRIPVLLTVPNATAALGATINGVTIYQHGITRNRSDMLAVADALADAGQAVVAIDLPLHGITDTSSSLYASDANPLYQNAAVSGGDATLVDGITELTFNLDEDGEAGIDDSGSYFINLESLLTSRDNLRQAAANLIHLTKTIPTIDYNAALDGGASGADFGGKPISFVGQSLGSITGTNFLGVNTDVGAAVLSVPGGKITELLAESPTFAPVINAGLAENGVIAGTRGYEEFLRNAQTVIDAGDPVNYGAAAAANHNILVHEVIGGGGSLPDQVIPNSATDSLIAAMGLSQVSTTTIDNTNGVSGLVKFTAGGHGSLLDPTDSTAATVEMQTEMAVFIGGYPAPAILPGGHGILIVDSSVIDP
ncbi:MAG: hypothetical protein R3217_04445 [Gammaproteobacteria bacterium]|nr:hypothetical protein [Gammaproteobacteria bacterium]